MSTRTKSLDAIIIGAGPAGIAMAYRLKHELNFHDFVMYEKLDGVGGTWRLNTYPGWYVEISTNYTYSWKS
jgi:cation diffusion facilitator CzcD-associated flavoprotein CzcO